ncbi:voltage-gated hydrogen channel 1 [Biomphalaria pfeifferi]|uniref:Voltage-gated hydrogen channel 1 n=1 Tax=Biomphalaria pfeifferi TaxID=112525 RepID=A0AAD8FMG1_BIOPF|nr:voltage-gated hydrogen channel 1 [Biomphalaria pfeifferi]
MDREASYDSNIVPTDQKLVSKKSTQLELSKKSTQIDVKSLLEELQAIVPVPEEEVYYRPDTLRGRIYIKLNSPKYMMVVIVLVIVDICLILVELFLELAYMKKNHPMPEEITMTFLLLSISILIIFVVEIIMRIYAMGLAYFTHLIEVFDGTVIIVSLILDLVTLSQSGLEVMAADMIILFRLWRVTRLFTGFISSLKRQAAIKSMEIEEKKKDLENQIEQSNTNCRRLKERIDYLTNLLKENHIVFQEWFED